MHTHTRTHAHTHMVGNHTGVKDDLERLWWGADGDLAIVLGILKVLEGDVGATVAGCVPVNQASAEGAEAVTSAWHALQRHTVQPVHSRGNHQHGGECKHNSSAGHGQSNQRKEGRKEGEKGKRERAGKCRIHLLLLRTLHCCMQVSFFSFFFLEIALGGKASYGGG